MRPRGGICIQTPYRLSLERRLGEGGSQSRRCRFNKILYWLRAEALATTTDSRYYFGQVYA